MPALSFIKLAILHVVNIRDTDGVNMPHLDPTGVVGVFTYSNCDLFKVKEGKQKHSRHSANFKEKLNSIELDSNPRSPANIATRTFLKDKVF